MISYIVATHDESVLEANLLAALELWPEDELVVVRDAPSITVAYAEGQQKASQPVRCYVHHDVQVLDTARLRTELIDATDGHGMVGVIGSRDAVMPWWNGDKLGSVVDTRMGRLDFGPGGECAMLDGLLLATRETVQWDTEAPGWHGYDQDACSQMLARGLANWCISDGAEFVVHNAAPVKDRSTGYQDAAARWCERWAA